MMRIVSDNIVVNIAGQRGGITTTSSFITCIERSQERRHLKEAHTSMSIPKITNIKFVTTRNERFIVGPVSGLNNLAESAA